MIFLPIVALALLGSVFALIGGVVFLLIPSWSKWLMKVSVPFAAGVLLTVAMVGLIPEALELYGENALLIVLGSFLSAYLFEHLFFSLHHHDEEHHHHIVKSIPLIVVGDTIHNFVDGVAIAASYLINPGLGVVTAVSTFLHEVPHEIGDFGILLKAGWSNKKVMVTNLCSALATLIGVFFVILFPQTEAFLGGLIALAAGLFLYLGATDFLPHLEHEEGSWTNIVALLAGVLIMLGTLYAVPHDHPEAEDHATEISGHVSPID
ncbi:MAG TPA: ZIP family metal transporter [Patescibacteria group bacterium]